MAIMVQECFVYIGTYTRRTKSEGIYIYRQDLATGQLSPAGVAQVPDSPAFVVPHPTGRYLYAVSEVGGFGGQAAGGVKAFSVDAQTGALALLNEQSSGGPGPCHVSVDKTGQYLLVANYSGGSVAMLPINEDGSLRPDYMDRLERILDRADDLGMAVILGVFYFGQDQRLTDEAAVLRALDGASLTGRSAGRLSQARRRAPATRHPPERGFRLSDQRTGFDHHRVQL